MKYFTITLETSSEKIKKFAKENDVDGYYGERDSILYELNRMLYKNMEKDIFFFIYSEEKNAEKILATFSYDNNKFSYDEAYSHIVNRLKEYGIS